MCVASHEPATGPGACAGPGLRDVAREGRGWTLQGRVVRWCLLCSGHTGPRELVSHDSFVRAGGVDHLDDAVADGLRQ
jgi:hypothetical protein